MEKSKGHNFRESIYLLNLEACESQLLYQLAKGWAVMFDSVERTGIIKGENYYVLLGNYDEKSYKVVEISREKSN